LIGNMLMHIGMAISPSGNGDFIFDGPEAMTT
jgi:hypothetical protein